jgi:hypothetical protein
MDSFTGSVPVSINHFVPDDFFIPDVGPQPNYQGVFSSQSHFQMYSEF